MDDTHKDGATPLDPDEIEGLVPTHITTHEELNRLEQQNIVEATQWLESARIADVLGLGFLRKLHRQMFGKVWKWAGQFRTSNKNIGVSKEEVAVELQKLFGDTRAQIEHKAYPADEIAWRFHHRLVWIHPFVNGNGRHARLLTDILLERLLNRPRFSWGSEDLMSEGGARNRYLQALRAADKGDYTLLGEFVRS